MLSAGIQREERCGAPPRSRKTPSLFAHLQLLRRLLPPSGQLPCAGIHLRNRRRGDGQAGLRASLLPLRSRRLSLCAKETLLGKEGTFGPRRGGGLRKGQPPQRSLQHICSTPGRLACLATNKSICGKQVDVGAAKCGGRVVGLGVCSLSAPAHLARPTRADGTRHVQAMPHCGS